MTIAVLSWGSHQTLTQTLQSYNEFGLDQLDDERIIYFQQISGEDIEIAKRFGWKWIGSTDNVGIAEGYKSLLEEATGEFFLFLENDWKLIEIPNQQLIDGTYLLDFAQVDIVRYRHRKNPGNPLWTRQFEGRETDRLTHLLDSVHWTDPSTLSSHVFKPHLISKNEWFLTSSTYANWTNNPHMAYTKFLRKNIVPHLGSRDLELDIQGWWEQQNFMVAQGDGLFTHERID